ncbi:MAG: hypothetical protein QOG23_3067, partial [Blastocatellia bacterium]|nr:hypothetical protein [Blastocatellia bacterium]
TSHRQFFNAVDACEEFLDGLRAEARGNVVVAVCAQTLTPTLSQKERESNCTTIESREFSATEC